MSNETAYRVGIVGCGYQGGITARAIAATPSFQVVACADPDQAAAARVAALAGGAPVFASADALLQEAEVDAVVVATSHDALYENALAALRAGKAVLCEKPIGIDEREAAQLEAVVEETGLCFMAGYSFRYFPAVQKMHKLLCAGAIGDVVSVIGSFGIWGMGTGWTANPQMGGGPLLFVGSHLIDQMLWFVPEQPVAVSATIRYRADTRTDETTHFQLQFANDVVAQGMVTQTATGLFNFLELHGRKGRMRLQSNGMGYTLDVISQTLPEYAQPTTLLFPQIDDARLVMHLPVLAEFAEAIAQRRQPAVTVSQGRRVLKVIDAIFKSDRTGDVVRLA